MKRPIIPSFGNARIAKAGYLASDQATYIVPYAEKYLINAVEGKIVTQYHTNFLYFMEILEITLESEMVIPFKILRRNLFLFYMLEGQVIFENDYGFVFSETNSGQCYATINDEGHYIAKFAPGKHILLYLSLRTSWIHSENRLFPRLQDFIDYHEDQTQSVTYMDKIFMNRDMIQALTQLCDAYSAPAVYVKEGGNWKIYYIFRDYLGSITQIANEDGSLKQELSYDAWGRFRNPVTQVSYTPDGEPELFLGRGYTGHEYLPWFGLLNMNARLYDPALGRFLSPDPYVQMPEFTQNFNRYSYALNNPLIYVDPDGEFFFGTLITFTYDLFVTSFIKGGLDPTSRESRREAWRNFDPTASGSLTYNAVKIDIGRFKTDPNKNPWQRAWQLFSRLTLEAYQTELGNLLSHGRNLTGNVDDVSYYRGVTLVNKKNNSTRDSWGLTLGSYMNSENVVADPYEDALFRHEFGHVLQSRIFGPLYVPLIGIPSFIGSKLDDWGLNDHKREWYETQANRMGERYFRKHEPGALITLPWDDNRYPRKYNPNWYWLFSAPPLPLMWLLFF